MIWCFKLLSFINFMVLHAVSLPVTSQARQGEKITAPESFSSCKNNTTQERESESMGTDSFSAKSRETRGSKT